LSPQCGNGYVQPQRRPRSFLPSFWLAYGQVSLTISFASLRMNLDLEPTELCNTFANKPLEGTNNGALGCTRRPNQIRVAPNSKPHLCLCFPRFAQSDRDSPARTPNAYPPNHSVTPSNVFTCRQTLGGEGGPEARHMDISAITTIQAQHPQWGKRYIFAPALTAEPDDCIELVARVLVRLTTRRALVLTPSFFDRAKYEGAA
jgi:hypothetical protein